MTNKTIAFAHIILFILERVQRIFVSCVNFFGKLSVDFVNFPFGFDIIPVVFLQVASWLANSRRWRCKFTILLRPRIVFFFYPPSHCRVHTDDGKKEKKKIPLVNHVCAVNAFCKTIRYNEYFFFFLSVSITTYNAGTYSIIMCTNAR